MFFCSTRYREGEKPHKKSKDSNHPDELAIWGTPEGRKGASLKVMSAVEQKLPKWYTKKIDGNYISTNESFDTDTVTLTPDEYAFALGKEGSTRKKINAAAGGIFEFLGYTAFICGDIKLRRRLRFYLAMLLKQKHNQAVILDLENKQQRDDLTWLKIPSAYMGILKTGPTLRDIESSTNTFLLIEGDVDLSDSLLIFGHDAKKRAKAEQKIRDTLRNVKIMNVLEEMEKKKLDKLGKGAGGINLLKGSKGKDGDDKDGKEGVDMKLLEEVDPNVVILDVPIDASILPEVVEAQLGQFHSLLVDKYGLSSVSKRMAVTHDSEDRISIQIRAERRQASRAGLVLENLISKEVYCEVPYYLPRGIPFSVLTGKSKEVFITEFDETERKQMRKVLQDPLNLLHYLDPKTMRIFGVPIVGETEQGHLCPSSSVPAGAIPVRSILEDVRIKTEVKVKVFQDQRRVQFSGNLAQCTAAKRELDETLSHFLTLVCQVNVPQAPLLADEIETRRNQVIEELAKEEKERREKDPEHDGQEITQITIDPDELSKRLSNIPLFKDDLAWKPLKEMVSKIGRELYPQLQNAHHLVALKANREMGTLSVSGSSTACLEASSKAETLIQRIAAIDLDLDISDVVAAKVGDSNEEQLMIRQGEYEDLDAPDPDILKIHSAYLLPQLRRTIQEKSHLPSSEWLRVSPADAAFILGKRGMTRDKISLVSGCRITINQSQNSNDEIVELSGTPVERRKARKYIESIRVQKDGAVNVDHQAHDDRDLSILNVPTDAVGFVTGAGGGYLRTTENDWCTLLFFCNYHHKKGREMETNDNNEAMVRREEKLAVFGSRRGQLGSKLRLMSAIENKLPGYFTRNVRQNYLAGDTNILINKIHGVPGDRSASVAADIQFMNDPSLNKEELFTPILCHGEWGIDTMWLKPDDLSFCLGKEGMTRKKLARSTNCVLEYVSNVAHLGGLKRERLICRDYIRWLLAQRNGVVGVEDLEAGLYSAKENYKDMKQEKKEREKAKEESKRGRKDRKRRRDKAGGQGEQSKL